MFDQHNVEDAQSVETRLLLLGIWRRRAMLAIAAVLSLLVGVLAGKYLAHGMYGSEAAMLYDTDAFHKAWDRDAVSPSTLVALVKTPANLKQVSDETGIAEARLDRASSADLDRDTGLLHIRVEWPDARTAQALTRKLRDAFVQNTRQALVAETKREVNAMRARLQQTASDVADANLNLQSFLSSNRVTSADLTTGQSTSAIAQLRLAYTEAQAERDALRQEFTAIRQSAATLESRLPQEKAAARVAAEAALNASRSQALLAMVSEERAVQANAVELRETGIELQRAKDLKKRGFISQQEFDRTQAAYQKAQAAVASGRDYDRWKAIAKELSSAQSTAVPLNLPTESLVAQLAIQANSLQLQLSMLDNKVARLRQQYEDALDLARRLPQLQSRYDLLNHRLQQSQQERNDLDGQLARAQAVLDANTTDIAGLKTVAEADLPTRPLKSRGKLIAMLVASGGLVCTLCLVVAGELRDKRLKAPAQLTSKLSMPVMGVVPRLPNPAAGGPQATPVEVDFLGMARRLRDAVPTSGAKVLLVSPCPGEGKSMVARGLASALTRSREKVLLLEAESAAAQRRHGLLEEGARSHDIVLIEGPPLADDAQVEQAVRESDAIVFVVQNYTHDVRTLRRALMRLNAMRTPIVGAIVTKVDPMYLEPEQRAV